MPESLSDCPPLVSVIIPTYNRPSHLLQALQTVESQTYDNLEVIVIDDGSETPGETVFSREKLEIDITVLHHEENKGASAARNTGIEHATGEFIAFLDDDDQWEPTKITRQVEAFQSASPSVGLVYTGRRYEGEEINEVTPHQEGIVTKEILMDNFVGSYSVIMVRSEIVEDVGLLDEKFPNRQDWEWYIRISVDWEFKAIPEVLVTIQISESQLSFDYDRMRNESYPLLFEKYTPIARQFGLLFLRKWRAQLYFHLGWFATVRTREYGLARRDFYRSFRQYPISWRPLVFFLATFFHRYFDAIPTSVKQYIGKLAGK